MTRKEKERGLESVSNFGLCSVQWSIKIILGDVALLPLNWQKSAVFPGQIPLDQKRTSCWMVVHQDGERALIFVEVVLPAGGLLLLVI